MKRDKNEVRPDAIRTISDDEIMTERKLARRSFLGSGGALLMAVGGISTTYAAQQDDPNKRPDDKPRPEDKPRPDDKPRAEDKAKPEDREKPRRAASVRSATQRSVVRLKIPINRRILTTKI